MKPVNQLRILALLTAPFIISCGAEGSWESEIELGEVQQALCTTSALPRQAVSASSQESANFSPAKAIDGNATTRWSSAFSDPQWLEVDLGAERWLNRVRLTWQTAASASYELQVRRTSTDAWATIHSDAAGNGGIDDISALGARARYVRMYSHARTTQWGNSLYEMEVFGDNNPNCHTVAIPARVEAEAYNSYSDSTSGDSGNGCPPADGVDTQLTSDPNGGTCNVGWTTPGEWLEYNLFVSTPQVFNFTARVASAYAGKTLHLELDGVNIGSLSAPANGWQAFANRTINGVHLSGGSHVLRVVFDTGLLNLNYVDITAVPPVGVLLPARIEAEAYDSFFDTTSANFGGACVTGDAVDKELTSDPNGGQCNVGWTDPGEWLQYKVHTDRAVSLNFTARVASAATGKSLHLELDGVNIGSLSSPSGGWQAFADRTLSNIAVSAGNHTLRVVFDTGLVNLNYIDVRDAPQVCADAVSGNVRSDNSRFNIVFVGAGFANDSVFQAAVRRAIDLDGIARIQTGTDGLMQIPVFKAARNRFNFFYVTGTQPFASSNPSPAEVEAALLRPERVMICQDQLPNRVIPMYLFRHVIPGGEGYPFGSFGRQSVIFADCDGQANCSAFAAQQTNVHEMMHTVTCLTDEYGFNGDGSANPLPWTDALWDMFTEQFWEGDSYSACLANAPWRGLIGNGCGEPGVIDCFNPQCIDTTTNPPTFNIPFNFGTDMREDCCLPGHPGCISEVACFQGGFRADTGIFRPTSGNILRRTDSQDLHAATFLSPVHVDLVNRLISKGPAVGLHWHGPPYYEYEFGQDCDMTLPGFDPDQ